MTNCVWHLVVWKSTLVENILKCILEAVPLHHSRGGAREPAFQQASQVILPDVGETPSLLPLGQVWTWVMK